MDLMVLKIQVNKDGKADQTKVMSCRFPESSLKEPSIISFNFEWQKILTGQEIFFRLLPNCEE